MHVVAATRLPRTPPLAGGYRSAAVDAPVGREELARALADLTGRDVYDWRLRLGGPLPWIVSSEPDAERAAARVGALRARGFGAVSCASEEAVPWSPEARAGSAVAAQLALGEDELELAGLRVRYDAIRVIVLATLDEETSREQIERTNVSLRARTIAPRSRPAATPISSYHRERAHARAAYLILGPRQRTIRVIQGAFGLAGPEGEGARTSFERFERAVEALLDRAPRAVRDTRMIEARRGRSRLSSRADGREHVASNVRETDLAARLIGLAWLEGQIDPA